MIPEVFRVFRAEKENTDTFTLWLRRDRKAEGAAKPRKSFEPGQFNMLCVFGFGESAISISGDPGAVPGEGSEETQEWVHTIRAVGTVTEALQRLSPGDSIGVRGPFGSSWPIALAEGKNIVLVAGGIGLAPLRSALYRIGAQREKYGDVTLLYGGRSPKDLIFRKELERLKHASRIDLQITVDHGEPGWEGSIGVVPSLISRTRVDPRSTVALVCGPEVMMRFTVDELSRLGLPDDSIFLSMERSMRCGVGFCGHCQFMPHFICKDGPVFSYGKIRPFFGKKEL